MAEQWLTIVEYSRTYKVSDMTVRRRIKTGKLHAVLKEGKYYIPISEGGTRAEPKANHPKVTSQPVMKAHPSPHRTFAPSQAVHHEAQSAYEDPAGLDDFEDDGPPQHSAIPQSLRRNFASHGTATVDARALMAFCEAAIKKAHDAERRSVERFKAKLESLEAQVGHKDLEIKSLKQAMEDLQLLVRVMEKKNRHASP